MTVLFSFVTTGIYSLKSDSTRKEDDQMKHSTDAGQIGDSNPRLEICRAVHSVDELYLQ